MGVIDIREALKKGSGKNFSFQNVTLGYQDGGRKQVLRYFFKHSKTNTASTQEHILEGYEDPVKAAVTIGQELAAQFDGD